MDQSHYVSTVMRLKAGGSSSSKYSSKSKTNPSRRRQPFVRLVDGGAGEEWLAELVFTGTDHTMARYDNKHRRRSANGGSSGENSIVAVCQERLRSSASTTAKASHDHDTSGDGGDCWLFVAPPKKKERMRWMVEKTTELGVTGYGWLDTDFAESGGDQGVPFSKLQAYAVEAAEQSERLSVPHFVTLDTRSLETKTTAVEVNGDQDTQLNDFLDFWAREAATKSTNVVRLLVCRERSNTTLPVWHALERVLLQRGADEDNDLVGGPISVAFVIGPEGGWSPQENDRMDALEREHPELFWNVSLGTNILRAETAAMTAVAAFTLFQDMQRK